MKHDKKLSFNDKKDKERKKGKPLRAKPNKISQTPAQRVAEATLTESKAASVKTWTPLPIQGNTFLFQTQKRSNVQTQTILV